MGSAPSGGAHEVFLFSSHSSLFCYLFFVLFCFIFIFVVKRLVCTCVIVCGRCRGTTTNNSTTRTSASFTLTLLLLLLLGEKGRTATCRFPFSPSWLFFCVFIIVLCCCCYGGSVVDPSVWYTPICSSRRRGAAWRGYSCQEKNQRTGRQATLQSTKNIEAWVWSWFAATAGHVNCSICPS